MLRHRHNYQVGSGLGAQELRHRHLHWLGFPDRACARSQKVLLDIVRKDLDRLLPEPLDTVRVCEDDQRREVGAAMDRLARSL